MQIITTETTSVNVNYAQVNCNKLHAEPHTATVFICKIIFSYLVPHDSLYHLVGSKIPFLYAAAPATSYYNTLHALINNNVLHHKVSVNYNEMTTYMHILYQLYSIN